MQISKKEYDSLLEYKQAFIDSMQLSKKEGRAYKKYKELVEMDVFFEKRYKGTYDIMKKNFGEWCSGKQPD